METIGNCQDCKFWKFKFWGSHGVAFCDRVDNPSDLQSDGFEIYASADDDSGLDAYLKTGPMFGCVLFEKGEK